MLRLLLKSYSHQNNLSREISSNLNTSRFSPEISVQSVKLNKRKIRYIINHRKKGESSETIAVDMKISRRRVEQIWKQYKETGKEPKIGINMGRPKDPFDPVEAEIIIEAYKQYKFGARMLETIIIESYNMHIPDNRIHMHLLSEGLAREEERKKKRRKWVRYEREHSMSAGHIDWHEESKDGIKVCAILDDASRKILAANLGLID